MMLALVLGAIAVLAASALLAALLGRSDRAALGLGSAGTVLACGTGLAASLAALGEGREESLRARWFLPIGGFHVGLDGLSAFFLACLFLVAGLAALYGLGYWRSGRRRIAPAMSFSSALVAAMALLLVARDAVLFLMAWEAMSISSFFLVTFEHEREEVRRAGMVYLIASQLGTAVLYVLFLLLRRNSPDFDFQSFAESGAPAGLASTVFLLALLGFGTKAGFWPLHVWLPEAHPAAPSPASAVMSGVMIQMGVYGFLRVLTFLGPAPAWWGAVLIGGGVLSGLAGVLHALAQSDLKRLLAYSSVENAGILALGLGLGCLGKSQGEPLVAFLGNAGALLHVLNHALLKGALFQTAGSVLHATGTRDLERLGGLARRMPRTSLSFLVAAVALSGLPPLNAFVGEWLIYMGAFHGGASLPTAGAVLAVTAIAALALIGGLAAACFARAFSLVFLGEPRSQVAADAHEAGPSLTGAQALGLGLAIVIGLWPEGALQLVGPLAARLSGIGAVPPAPLGPLPAIARVAFVLLGLVAALALLRALLLARRPVAEEATWGCGYARVSPRMQYTAASFAQPLLAPFSIALLRRVQTEAPRGFFPAHARHEEHPLDLAGERLFAPAARSIVRALSRLHVLQKGHVQLYLAYVFATLVLLMLWQLGLAGS